MRRVLTSLLFTLFASMAGAQQGGQSVFSLPAQPAQSILTVDVDRLFAQSAFGERISREFTEGGEVLFNENQNISAALRDEELALAAQRSTMAPELFRAEAEAFDDKAQAIRRAQDAKVRDLEATLSTGREQFLLVSRPILEALMIDRGAAAILDRRLVLLSLGSIDVTDVAIARIDAAIGDGSNIELDQIDVPVDPAPEE